MDFLWEICCVFPDLLKNQYFPLKIPNFFTTAFFWNVFKKWYFFSCIQRQNCSDMVIIKLSLKSWNWQPDVKKAGCEWMIFLNLNTVGNYESSDCSADNGENVLHQWKTFNFENFGLQRFEIIKLFGKFQQSMQESWKSKTFFSQVILYIA